MSSELSLQQKLRVDTQLRVEELEECVLEKEQEIISLKQIVSRLQGEVYARAHTHTLARILPGVRFTLHLHFRGCRLHFGASNTGESVVGQIEIF